MSVLFCLDQCIFDLNVVESVSKFDNRWLIRFRKSDKTIFISEQAFVQFQRALKEKEPLKQEVERLTKENQHLRGVIAALPGMGEDYKTAHLEFEHVAAGEKNQ